MKNSLQQESEAESSSMTKMNQTIVTIILFALSGSVAACALEPGGSEDDFDPAEPTTEESVHALRGQELIPEEAAALAATSASSTGDCGLPRFDLDPPLINRKGLLMTHVQVYDIRWGAVQDGAQLNNFMRWIASSNYVANLGHEYDGNQSQGQIGRGDFVKGLTAPNGRPPEVVHDRDIHKEIEWLIDHGHLPAGGNNNAFFVYLPPNVNAITTDGTPSCRHGEKSCFCAYHSWYTPKKGGHKRFYAVMPDMARAPGFCGGPGNDLGDRTVAASHELAEMVTDPSINAWKTRTGWEIGDLCNSSRPDRNGHDNRYRNSSTSNWWVQCEYSNRRNGCVDNL